LLHKSSLLLFLVRWALPAAGSRWRHGLHTGSGRTRASEANGC